MNDLKNESEWKYHSIGSLLECNIDYRGKTPPKSKSGIPVLSAANVKNGKIDTSHLTFVSESLYEKWTTRGFPKPGDVLITTEAPVGEVATFPDDKIYLITRRIIALRGKDGILNNNFLKYSLLNPRLKKELLSYSRGSTVPRILKDDILNFKIPVPSIKEQNAIVKILKSLDDKIELNRQMNETLEALARRIFKSWFIDFDPVRTKAEGKQPAGMDAETAALFPDGFEMVDGREVPKGWRVEALGNVADMTKGRSYTSDELQESTTALVTLKSFQRGGGYRQDGLKPFVGEYKPDQIIQPGELVISFTDVTQAAEVIGKPALVSANPYYQIFVASLDVGIIRPKDERVNVPFLYLLLRNDEYQSHIYGYCSGTTVLHLDKSGVPEFEFICPDIRIMRQFFKITKPIFNEIENNIQQSRTLAQIRDALLPKLMSGEINLSQINTAVQESV